MSRVFESCLKSLLYGCTDCVLADDCAEKQLYNKGRADGIDECIKMVTDEKLCLKLEKMKEQINGKEE